jgi:hypothetical protein
MAIRIINGATIKDILPLFLKEYYIIAIVAAIIAYPISYKVMSIWIEKYIFRIEIGYAMWLLILLAFIVCITGIIVFSI